MNRTAISLLALTLFASSARADLTINGLGAGGAVSGTDIFPAYQGANPAVGVTANQIKTFAAGSGSVTFISTLTANNTATSLAWTGLTGNDYRLVCRNILTATAGDNLTVQFGEGAGPTWETASYTYGQIYATPGSGPAGGGGTSQSGFGFSTGNTTGAGLSLSMDMYALATTTNHVVTSNSITFGSVNTFMFTVNGAYVGDTNVITAVRLFNASAHNLLTGTCSLYSVAS